MPEKQPDAFDTFIDTLPDPAGARIFLTRLQESNAPSLENWLAERLLMSRLLTIAGHSPFLAETLLRDPEHIAWLKLESDRGIDRVKSIEQLSEELARFVTRTIDVDHSIGLARFKRRELLRIYLRDCVGIATLSEITEELSNLADVILSYALSLSLQEMINRHGAPLTNDEKGRIEKAEFAIIALGKLGCRELNYASDIDLFFLYSGSGETAGDGRRSESVITNKQFFTSVADRVVQLIGRSSAEGAVYRIDLRLRPYGRDGEMVCEIDRATEYYRKLADNWERQALIRARASAGSSVVVTRFLDAVRDVIFSLDALPNTLEGVRRAKENIERQEAGRSRGFNVKLGRGGIREIEFIAQALQLKHGGREPWVRSAQTLIVLARLAEKNYLTELERSRLSEAYTFLRLAEHRLQMEHGAQTHTLPSSERRMELLARRCGYLQSISPAAHFLRDLEKHTGNVRSVYDRVFAPGSSQLPVTQALKLEGSAEALEDQSVRLIKQAAGKLRSVIADGSASLHESERIERMIAGALPKTINPSRALRHLVAWADSLATYARDQALDDVVGNSNWAALVERLVVVLSSQYLSHLLLSRPLLAAALAEDQPAQSAGDFMRILQESITKEISAATKPDALRRAWYGSAVAIGYQDMKRAGHYQTQQDQPANIDADAIKTNTSNLLRKSNLAQTALAEATLSIATQISLETIGFKGVGQESLPFSVLGLGRLGHAGMDFGSDLDLLVVFDDEQTFPAPSAENPISTFQSTGPSAQEFYASLTAEIIRVLSSITREGLLYRIDLRLRPEGKNGPIAVGLNGLLSYLKNRASAWEHSAYLKAREVTGDLAFGRRVRELISEVSFDAASANPSLRQELREMRERQVKEKTRGGGFNIKVGYGGMSDVYFITRYIQLRDRIYFPPERGTSALISRLGELGALDPDSAEALFQGYTFLRQLDHWMRLLMDRPSPLIPRSRVVLQDITRAMAIESLETFEKRLADHTTRIREAYDRVFD